jgi:hypothetical protein
VSERGWVFQIENLFFSKSSQSKSFWAVFKLKTFQDFETNQTFKILKFENNYFSTYF